MERKMNEIFARHDLNPTSLIALLQDTQVEFGYLPCDALEMIATKINVPLSKVFSVSTFYNAFSLNKKGDVVVKICTGTACHIRGAQGLVDEFRSKLQVKIGETTKDGKFTIETVNCLGACAMAPLVSINGQYKEKTTIKDVYQLIGE